MAEEQGRGQSFVPSARIPDRPDSPPIPPPPTSGGEGQTTVRLELHPLQALELANWLRRQAARPGSVVAQVADQIEAQVGPPKIPGSEPPPPGRDPVLDMAGPPPDLSWMDRPPMATIARSARFGYQVVLQESCFEPWHRWALTRAGAEAKARRWLRRRAREERSRELREDPVQVLRMDDRKAGSDG